MSAGNRLGKDPLAASSLRAGGESIRAILGLGAPGSLDAPPENPAQETPAQETTAHEATACAHAPTDPAPQAPAGQRERQAQERVIDVAAACALVFERCASPWGASVPAWAVRLLAVLLPGEGAPGADASAFLSGELAGRGIEPVGFPQRLPAPLEQALLLGQALEWALEHVRTSRERPLRASLEKTRTGGLKLRLFGPSGVIPSGGELPGSLTELCRAHELTVMISFTDASAELALTAPPGL